MSNPRLLTVCLALIAALFGAQAVLPDYFVLALTRIMIMAVFAMGYNVLMGYVGMLSLGHALFFAAGLYAAGLSVIWLGLSLPAAFGAGVVGGLAVAALTGLLALRTRGVAFMIVTLMFAQVGYLLILQFQPWTGGDQGMTLPAAARGFDLFGARIEMTSPPARYDLALGLFAVVLLGVFALTQGPFGRLMRAVRENPDRTEMLGFDVVRVRLVAFIVSGAVSGAAGAMYGLMFGFVGASFAEFRTSVEVLLYTLVGGPGTLLGPVLGTGLMTLLIDRLSGITSAYMIVVGVALIALVLWFPKGILGWLRDRGLPWLR